MSLASLPNTMQRKLFVAALSLTAAAQATAASSWSVYAPGTAPMTGITTQVTLDSALSGLALSNGSANPFKAPAYPLGPQGFINALNSANATVAGDALNAVSSSESLYGTREKALKRDTVVLRPQQTTVELDSTTGKLLSAGLSGSYTITAPMVVGTVLGGSATLSDLKIDFTKGVIIGDLLSNAGTSFEVKSNDMVMFHVGQLSGISGIDFSAASAAAAGDSTLLTQQGWTIAPPMPGAVNAIAMSGWLELQNLQASDQFMQQFADSIGAPEGNTTYNLLASLNSSIFSAPNPGHGWGTLRLGLGVRVNNSSWYAPSTILEPVALNATQLLQPVTAAVPEPDAAALMLVGLVGIGAAAARQRKAIQVH